MNERLWNIYLALQTEMAYPNEPHVFEYNEKAIGEAVEFYTWLVGTTGMQSPSTLLIGPGGVNEVEAMRRAGASPFKILTAHAPEKGAIHRAHVGAYDIVVGDMHDMPLATASLDLLYASNVMEHALAPYIALMECRRVLKVGGKAYFILPSFAGVEGGKGPFHLHCLTREVWEELLHKTGFTISESKIYPPEVSDPSVPHYLCFLCGVTTPPHPHSQVLARLKEYKA